MTLNRISDEDAGRPIEAGPIRASSDGITRVSSDHRGAWDGPVAAAPDLPEPGRPGIDRAPSLGEIHDALLLLRGTSAPASTLEALDRWFAGVSRERQRQAPRT